MYTDVLPEPGGEADVPGILIWRGHQPILLPTLQLIHNVQWKKFKPQRSRKHSKVSSCIIKVHSCHNFKFLPVINVIFFRICSLLYQAKRFLANVGKIENRTKYKKIFECKNVRYERRVAGFSYSTCGHPTLLCPGLEVELNSGLCFLEDDSNLSINYLMEFLTGGKA
jgi:hypothetical protein